MMAVVDYWAMSHSEVGNISFTMSPTQQMLPVDGEHKAVVCLPWQDCRLFSSWPGTTGPPLGPERPHEGVETDLSPLPLRCDWAYRPGEKGMEGGTGKSEAKQM